MRIPWNRPREIVIGRGETMIAHGVKNGRPFVFIRPADQPGEIGSCPPGYDPHHNDVRANRRDTIIWLDAAPTGLMAALRKAYAALWDSQTYACTRCGRTDAVARQEGCERGPCPMEPLQ